MIDIVAVSDLNGLSGDLLILPGFEDRVWGPGAADTVDAAAQWLDDYLDGLDFTGKAGQTAAIPGGDAFGRVLFVGLGAEVDADALRKAAGVAGRSALRYERVVSTLSQVEIDGATEAVASGFILGQYKFEKYLSKPKPSQTAELVLVGGHDQELERAKQVAGGVAMARDLINEPAGGKRPEVLAEIAVEMAADLGIEITVYDETEIEAERFGGLRAVSLGATNPPRMVVFEYAPAEATALLKD